MAKLHKITQITIGVYSAVFLLTFLWSRLRHLPWLEPIQRHFSWPALFYAGAGTLLLLLFNYSLTNFLKRYRFGQDLIKLVETYILPSVKEFGPLDIVIVSLCAGVVEEALFRGVLQAELGLVLASILFGLAHMGSREMANMAIWIMIMGFILGSLYLRSGNIVSLMATHAVYDLVVLLHMRYFYVPIFPPPPPPPPQDPETFEPTISISLF
jgi:membrane protease YdiL (CAAX protease family)